METIVSILGMPGFLRLLLVEVMMILVLEPPQEQQLMVEVEMT